MTEEEMRREALRMLKRATSEGRWYPRRHMRIALLIFLPLFLILLLAINAFRGCGGWHG